MAAYQNLSSIKLDIKLFKERTTKSPKEMLRYYSELLVNPEAKQIPLNEWLSAYNGAKDGHLKHILRKCIPYVESLDFVAMDDLITDCFYERCDLMLSFVSHHETAAELILNWLLEEVSEESLAEIDCPNHCLCSLCNLGIGLTGKGTSWTPHLLIRLLPSIKRSRCALNSYLDLVLVSVEANIEDYSYIERLYYGLIFRINPSKQLNLEGTIDDKPEIMFNGISDCLLMRKMVLPHLMILTRLNLSTVIRDTIDQQLSEMVEQVSKAIHWSSHPLIDLLIEDDTMLLKGVYCLVYIHGTVIDDELAAHKIFEKFVDSINHDTRIIIDWLTSDSEVATLTLKLLLAYLKLPHIDTKCSKIIKTFWTQLLEKIDKLWNRKIFPYNPSALTKHSDRFDFLDSEDEITYRGII